MKNVIFKTPDTKYLPFRDTDTKIDIFETLFLFVLTPYTFALTPYTKWPKFSPSYKYGYFLPFLIQKWPKHRQKWTKFGQKLQELDPPIQKFPFPIKKNSKPTPYQKNHFQDHLITNNGIFSTPQAPPPYQKNIFLRPPIPKMAFSRHPYQKFGVSPSPFVNGMAHS